MMQRKTDTDEGASGRHAEDPHPGADVPGIARMPLWRGWALAALAWLVHLYASFALVDWYCRGGSAIDGEVILLLLHGVSLLCLLLALIGLWLGWRNWRALHRESSPAKGETRYTRRHFLVLGGMVMSGYLSVIILMQAWANFVLVPCQ